VIRLVPQVSIVMAIKNASRFMREALDSIAAQSFQDYEVVVVDGGSEDDGVAIATSYPKVFCISQEGTGYADAWNTGIAAGRGGFIAFLDSDDLWTPEKLEAQLKAFVDRPECEYVFGRVKFFISPGETLPRGFRSNLLQDSYLIPTTGTAMIRRETLRRVGPLDTTLRIAADIPWIAKIRETSIVAHIDDVLLLKRLHSGNLGHTVSQNRFHSELLQVLQQRAHEHRMAKLTSGNRS